MSRDLPPGVGVNDIPGNRPEDEAYEKFQELTHTEKRILLVLLRYDDWQWDIGNCWISFSKMAKDIHRSYEETLDAVHILKDKGYLTYEFAINEEGMLKGSGYFLARRYC